MDDARILALMRPAVLVCDREGFIRRATGGFGGYAGWPIESFVGRHTLDIVIEEDRQWLLSVFLGAQARDDFTVSLPIPFVVRTASPDGVVFCADAIATGNLDSDDEGWVVVLHPHDQHATPVTALTSLLVGDPLIRTLELAADHVAGSGVDHRRLAAFIVTDLVPTDDDDDPVSVLGTAMPPELSEPIRTVFGGRDADVDGPIGRDVRQIRLDDLPNSLARALAAHDFEELMVTRIDTDGVGFATLVGANGIARDPLPHNIRQLLDRTRSVAELALHRAHEHRLLLHASNHDPLTGLGNRRRLDERLESLAGRELALVFVDLDRFKAVNDIHGHLAGDAVLSTVAERIAAACRPGDLACRVGGDEFIAVLVDVTPDEAERIAARMSNDIAAPLPAHIGPTAVTASLGLTHVAGATFTTRDEMIAHADDAMRENKTRHRAVATR